MLSSEVPIKMSTCAKQVTPNRCYCRVQDEKLNLSEIAKLITTLNVKVLGLRNDVNDLKNITTNEEETLFLKSNSACTHASSCHCEREPYAPRCNVKFDKSIASEKSKFLADFFENNFTNKIGNDKIDNETSKNTTDMNFILPNERLQATYYAPVFEDELKENKKNISKGVQCDSISTMERKRKRTLLSCFKTEAYIKEHNIFKPNKKIKISTKTTNTYGIFDPYVEKEKLTNIERNHNSHEKFLEPAIYDLQRNNLSKNDLDECRVELPKDEEDECQLLKFSKSRMGGGAEIRGNRLISDFYDKMQKINLYKNVKFDARNVKKRLDACIDELNGIIEDVSLIFPNLDTSEEFQK